MKGVQLNQSRAAAKSAGRAAWLPSGKNAPPPSESGGPRTAPPLGGRDASRAGCGCPPCSQPSLGGCTPHGARRERPLGLLPRAGYAWVKPNRTCISISKWRKEGVGGGSSSGCLMEKLCIWEGARQACNPCWEPVGIPMLKPSRARVGAEHPGPSPESPPWKEVGKGLSSRPGGIPLPWGGKLSAHSPEEQQILPRIGQLAGRGCQSWMPPDALNCPPRGRLPLLAGALFPAPSGLQTGRASGRPSPALKAPPASMAWPAQRGPPWDVPSGQAPPPVV